MDVKDMNEWQHVWSSVCHLYRKNSLNLISNLQSLHMNYFWVTFFSISNCILMFYMKMSLSYTLHRRFTYILHLFWYAVLKQVINSLFRFLAGHYCYWTEQILLRFLILLLISSGLLSGDFQASRRTVLCFSILLTSTTVLLFASGFLVRPKTNSG